MKNDSPMFPFETPNDKFFDHNKDGKLTGTETIFRDASLMEISKNAQKHDDKTTKHTQQNNAKIESSGKVTAYCIVAIVSLLLYLWNGIIATIFLIAGVIIISKIFKNKK